MSPVPKILCPAWSRGTVPELWDPRPWIPSPPDPMPSSPSVLIRRRKMTSECHCAADESDFPKISSSWSWAVLLKAAQVLALWIFGSWAAPFPPGRVKQFLSALGIAVFTASYTWWILLALRDKRRPRLRETDSKKVCGLGVVEFGFLLTWELIKEQSTSFIL